MRPVEIKGSLVIQVSHSDGRQMTTKNYPVAQAPFSELITAGYANILLETTTEALSLRITKKGEPLLHRESGAREQVLSHDRSKSRLLDSSDPFLIAVGISDAKGNIKPSKSDKYKQVEEFLRLLTPTLTAAISAGQIHTPTESEPLTIVDLGCGHAYLTFAAHQYLRAQGIPVKVIGIDIRTQARDRNNQIAKDLGIESTIEFRAEEISDTKLESADVAIALHACDTATDDAIAWAVKSNAGLILVAPCCQHDLQSKLKEIPEPWSLVTKHGILKERLADILTDSIRAQILKLLGYRTDVIEFIGGEHTPKNLLIRGVKTEAKPEQIEIVRYQEMLKELRVVPALAARLGDSFTF